MHLVRIALLCAGCASSAALAACGSSGADDYAGSGGGKPASPTATHSDGGSSTTPKGTSGSGGSSGGGGTSTGADAGTGSFGSQTVTSFTLIDAQITTDPDGSPIEGFDPIAYGATIDLATAGLYLSMTAKLPPVGTIGSVAFAIDATYTHTSSAPPYSVCGDDGKGNFTPCVFGIGKHTLTTTIYPQPDLGGAPYEPTVFEFTVTDSGDGGADAYPE